MEEKENLKVFPNKVLINLKEKKVTFTNDRSGRNRVS
jgi:hypothetical protein